MKRTSFLTILILLLLSFYNINAQVFANIDFESGEKPDGWTEDLIDNDVNLDYWTGGYTYDIDHPELKRPRFAHDGDYNMIMYREDDNIGVARLISPPLDLSLSIKPELSFYRANMTLGADVDELWIYVKQHPDSNWFKLEEYIEDTDAEPLGWKYETIFLPDSLLSETFYIAFEGRTQWGSGVCVDDIMVVEKGIIPKYVRNIETTQASNNILPSNSKNNPVLRIKLDSYGNTGELYLNELNINALYNSADIDNFAVKLYLTEVSYFSTESHLGNFSIAGSNGTLTNINHMVPDGTSYLWITVNVDTLANHGSLVDMSIPSDGIKFELDTTGIAWEENIFPDGDQVKYLVGFDTLAVDINSSYPETTHSPTGNRKIEESVFYDSFKDSLWTLTGDFEIGKPLGLGEGFDQDIDPDPSYAISDSSVLGNDLSDDGLYQANVDSIYAQTPIFDLYYFKDVKISFYRWLNLEYSDKASISFTADSGKTWNVLNNGYSGFTDNHWTFTYYSLNKTITDRCRGFAFRVNLDETDASTNKSGWNIDNFAITGDYILNDVGVTGWITPTDGCGHSDMETVTIKIKNYGPVVSEDTIPVGYSFNGGSSYVYDTLFETINPGEEKLFTFSQTFDLSTPGHYDNVIAKTFLEKDEYSSNDEKDTFLYIEPTYMLPYSQNFESSSGFWFAGGTTLWEHGTPSPFATTIKTAASGTKAWVTDLDNYYNAYDSSYLESPCFNFTGSRLPIMEFKINYITQNNTDGATILYSSDGGETWNYFDSLDYEWNWNWYSDDLITSLNLRGFENTSGGWKTARQFIPEVLRDEASVKFRFLFQSKVTGYYYDGVGIDDIKFFEAPPDVGVYEVVGPDSACSFDEPQHIKIAVKNYGADTLFSGTKIPVGFNLNGSPYTMDTLVINKEVVPFDTIHFTFSDSLVMDVSGRYYLDIFTKLAGDNNYYNNLNDTLETFISVYGMPEYDLGPTIGIEIIDTTLDAGPGFSTYDWENGDGTTRYYYVTSPGMYNLKMTNIHGCIIEDSVRVLQSSEDLGVIELMGPFSDCEFDGDTTLSVKIKNFRGAVYVPGDTIVVAYKLNKNPVVIDSIFLSTGLAALDTLEYEFNSPVNLSSFIDYNFEIYTILDGDLDYSNDTLTTTISAWGYPDVEIGPDTLRTTRADTIVFDAFDPEFDTYLWQDLSTNPTFSPSNRRSEEYKVTVTDIHGCGTETDSVQIIAYDIAAYSLSNPVSACEQSNDEEIIVNVRNMGEDIIPSGSQINVSYVFEGQPETNENITLISDLSPGTYITHTFTPHINLGSLGDYDLMVLAQYNRDVKSSNDTIETVISHWGYPSVELGYDTIVTDMPDTIILSADAGYTSYSWNTGETSSSISIPEDGSGWYTVSVANEFGCITKDSTFVFTYDVGVISLQQPSVGCSFSENQIIQIRVWNYSDSDIPSGFTIPVNYRIDDGITITEDFIVFSLLSSGSYDTYTFTTTSDMSDAGSYKIDAFTSLNYDIGPSNDLKTTNVEAYGRPDINIGPDTLFTLQPDTVVLIAEPGYESYTWNTGETENSISVTENQSKLYFVEVLNDNGCTTIDSVMIISANLGITNLTSPVSNCELSGSEIISAQIYNESVDTFLTGMEIDIAYDIDNSGPVYETHILTSNLLPGNSFIHTFAGSEDFSAEGSSNVRVFFTNNKDADSSDDNVIFEVSTFGYPEIDLGKDTTVIAAFFTLDAGGPYATYNWMNSPGSQTYDVTESGTFYVDIVDLNGCEGYDTINIILITPDIALTNLLNPVSKCYSDGNVKPKVRIKNTGDEIVNSGDTIQISYKINDVDIDSETFTFGENLIPGDSVDFEFTNSVDVLQFEDHVFEFTTKYENDLQSSNDKITIYKNIYPYPDAFLGNDTSINSKQYTLAPEYNENYSYEWQDGSSDSIYTAIFKGVLLNTFNVTITDNRMANCSSFDEIRIEFRIIDITLNSVNIPSSICRYEKFNTSINIKNTGTLTLLTSEDMVLGLVDEDNKTDEFPFRLNSALSSNSTATVNVDNVSLKHSNTQNVKFYVLNARDADQTNDTITQSATTTAGPEMVMGGDKDTLYAEVPVILIPIQSQVSYKWQDNSTLSTFNATSPAWYWVEIEGNTGCVTKDSVYVAGYVSIFEMKNEKEPVYVYPIPAYNVLNIKSAEQLTTDYYYEIISFEGRIVKNGKLNKNIAVDYSVDINNLSSGIYYIRIYNQNESYTRKLIFKTSN